MPAAATAPARSASVRSPARVLAVGALASGFPLGNLFARSHWALEHEPDLHQLNGRLHREPCAAVLCNSDEWKQVVAALESLPAGPHARPLVIALSENLAPEDWLRAVENQVHVIDSKQFSPPQLFSVLNHAWRVRNEAH